MGHRLGRVATRVGHDRQCSHRSRRRRRSRSGRHSWLSRGHRLGRRGGHFGGRHGPYGVAQFAPLGGYDVGLQSDQPHALSQGHQLFLGGATQRGQQVDVLADGLYPLAAAGDLGRRVGGPRRPDPGVLLHLLVEGADEGAEAHRLGGFVL